MKWITNVLILSYFLVSSGECTKPPPNIILIVADDLGFNDIGFHGSNQIPTPNIDALAYNGIILNRHYVQPLCTPTRAALLTGKYPIHIGMQHNVIAPDEPWGLPLEEKLLPEILHDNGYKTHLIGKWHLGFYRKKYTPTFRGFDTHFGYLGGAIQYFQHSFGVVDERRPYKPGLDIRHNLNINYDVKGQYATDLFTNAAINVIDSHNHSQPLFLEIAHLGPHAGNFTGVLAAPVEEVRRFYYIKGDIRRRLAATISLLDKSVGKVVKALKNNQMLDNSVIIFMSDNGGPSIGFGQTNSSNFPLRGEKNTPWEGGVRSVTAIWSPLLKNQQRVSNQLIHVTDWFPTLLSLANITIQHKIDGTNVWNSISENLQSPRKEILVNIDPISGYSAFIKDNYKYVNGSATNGREDQWYGQIGNEVHTSSMLYSRTILKSDVGLAIASLENNNTLLTTGKIQTLRQEAKVNCPNNNNHIQCNSVSEVCLFNILDDPCERNNLAKMETHTLQELQTKVNEFVQSAMPPRNREYDVRSDPSRFNGTWTWWWDELEINEQNVK